VTDLVSILRWMCTSSDLREGIVGSTIMLLAGAGASLPVKE
jgi:hypothetical protein